MNHLVILTLFFLCRLHDHGVSSADPVSVSVMEGDSVTLNTGVETEKHKNMNWYYSAVRIAQIYGNQSKICTDVQCERFRDRLYIDIQTGSLNITNIKTEDSGLYYLEVISNGLSQKIFNVTVHGVFSVGLDKVTLSLMEGDSVTFTTGVRADQQNRITWYFNGMRIAQINGTWTKICADEECKNMDGRFRERLKVDNQTGSLTITNTTNTDSGLYQLKITSKNIAESDKTFNFAIRGVLAADQTKSTNEGESVTLHPSKFKIPRHFMVWYFNDIRIAEITGYMSMICTYDQCKDERNIDITTGSLTITNTTTQDSGEYKVQIHSSRFSIERIFRVSVTAAPDFRLPPLGKTATVAICSVVLLLLVFVATAISYYIKKEKEKKAQKNNEAGLPLQPISQTGTKDKEDEEENAPLNKPMAETSQ